MHGYNAADDFCAHQHRAMIEMEQQSQRADDAEPTSYYN
jgi:hypothetical protein